MVDEWELRDAVDAAFVATGAGLAPWPNPHADWSGPADDEYSRTTNPARWRIIGARADAWLAALEQSGLAFVERDGAVAWSEAAPTVLIRTNRAVPRASGALALVIGRSRIADVDDAGVTVGVGDPASAVTWLPFCGCDACDDGSQSELDRLDEWLHSIVMARFRRLIDTPRTRRHRSSPAPAREITVLNDRSSSATGSFRPGEIDEILADPTGWAITSGTTWLPQS